MKRLLPGSAAFTPLQREKCFGRGVTSAFWSVGHRSGVNAALLRCLVVLVAYSASAQDADKIPKLAPPYPELPPTFWEQHGNAIIFSGIVLVLLVAFGVWLGLRKKPAMIVLPEVQARNELKALQVLPEDGAILSKVSQVLRRYFIAAFALPPGEYTTAEFCRIVSGNEKIGAELSSSVTAFLRNCDENKFSPASATPLSAVARALELIERGEALRQPVVVVKS